MMDCALTFLHIVCYNQVQSSGTGNLSACPFCSDVTLYDVIFEPSSSSSHSCQQDSSTPDSTPSPGRKAAKEVFVPLATSSDRQEIEESIKRANKTINPNSKSTPRSASLNKSNHRTEDRKVFTPFASSFRHHMNRSMNDVDDSSKSNDKSILSNINIADIRSIEDLEELMFQEAMKMSMTPTNTESNICSNNSVESGSSRNSNSSNEKSTSNSNSSASTSDFLQSGNHFETHNTMMYGDMSEDEQLRLALELSMQVSCDIPQQASVEPTGTSNIDDITLHYVDSNQPFSTIYKNTSMDKISSQSSDLPVDAMTFDPEASTALSLDFTPKNHYSSPRNNYPGEYMPASSPVSLLDRIDLALNSPMGELLNRSMELDNEPNDTELEFSKQER